MVGSSMVVGQLFGTLVDLGAALEEAGWVQSAASAQVLLRADVLRAVGPWRAADDRDRQRRDKEHARQDGGLVRLPPYLPPYSLLSASC